MRSLWLSHGFHAAVVAAVLPAPQVPWSSLLAREPEPGIREDLIAEVSPDVASDEWELITTRDGAEIAWREKRAGKYISVLNGKRCGVPYDEVSSLQFNTDGKRFSFSARKGKQWFVVEHGVEGPSFDDVGRPRYTPLGGAWYTSSSAAKRNF